MINRRIKHGLERISLTDSEASGKKAESTLALDVVIHAVGMTKRYRQGHIDQC